MNMHRDQKVYIEAAAVAFPCFVCEEGKEIEKLVRGMIRERKASNFVAFAIACRSCHVSDDDSVFSSFSLNTGKFESTFSTFLHKEKTLH